jgi:hypothetical protein
MTNTSSAPAIFKLARARWPAGGKTRKKRGSKMHPFSGAETTVLRDDHGIERPEEKGRWRRFGHATE